MVSAANLFGRVAYPDKDSLDRALEEGKKATTASSALTVGRVVSLSQSTGQWAQATSGDTGRAGVIPKLYQGKSVNTDSSGSVVVLTGEGAEVYVEAADAIKPGGKVTFGNGGTVKNWSSGIFIGHYVGHYGESIGAGEPPTDAAAAEGIRIRLERG